MVRYLDSQLCRYFRALDRATVFAPVLSPSYYTSVACYDESKYVVRKVCSMYGTNLRISILFVSREPKCRTV